MTSAGDENPFSPPGEGVPLRADDVATPFERLGASRLLKARERGGYTLGLHYRWRAPGYVTGVLSLTGLLAFFGFFAFMTDLWFASAGFFLVLGFLAGILVRDFSTALEVRQGWPLTEKVVDWRIVRRLAGQDPDGPAA